MRTYSARKFIAILLPLLLLVMPGKAPAASEADTLVVALGTDPKHFDPQAGADYDNYSVNSHIYSNLFKFDRNYKIVPDLVTDVQASAGGVEWTFSLRRGVKFHDGTPFTADDVVATFTRVLDRKNGLAHYSSLNFIKSVSAVDAYRVKFVLHAPYAPFFGQLAGPYGNILSDEVIAKKGDILPMIAIGTGPYYLQKRSVGEEIVLQRNESYYGPKPFFRRIIWRPVSEDGTRVALAQRGDADVVVRIPPTVIPQFRANPNIDLISAPTNIIFIQLNVKKPPLTDVKVRRALNYAVNKEQIVRVIMAGTAKVSTSFHTPFVNGYVKVGPYPYDPARAKQLLQEAGAVGAKITLLAPQGRYVLDSRVAEAVVQQLRDVGLDASLQLMGDWSTYTATIWKTQHDMNMLGWGPGGGDIDPLLYRTLHSDNLGRPWNMSNYANKQVDQLIDAGRATVDPKKRIAIYDELLKVLWEDAPWLFLYDQTSYTAVRKSVKGAIMLPTELYLFMEASRQ